VIPLLRFLLKFTALFFLLLFGVLLGFQQANEGMLKMKGYEDPHLAGAFEWKWMDEGYEATILGETVTHQDLEEKKERMEEIVTANIFTKMAKKLARALEKMFDPWNP
jgi:Protein of unknown function (DUF3679).